MVLFVSAQLYQHSPVTYPRIYGLWLLTPPPPNPSNLSLHTHTRRERGGSCLAGSRGSLPPIPNHSPKLQAAPCLVESRTSPRAVSRSASAASFSFKAIPRPFASLACSTARAG
jgi:hypothetical protein